MYMTKYLLTGLKVTVGPCCETVTCSQVTIGWRPARMSYSSRVPSVVGCSAGSPEWPCFSQATDSLTPRSHEQPCLGTHGNLQQELLEPINIYLSHLLAGTLTQTDKSSLTPHLVLQIFPQNQIISLICLITTEEISFIRKKKNKLQTERIE